MVVQRRAGERGIRIDRQPAVSIHHAAGAERAGVRASSSPSATKLSVPPRVPPIDRQRAGGQGHRAAGSRRRCTVPAIVEASCPG